MREGVSYCRKVCLDAGGCAPVWEGVSLCGRVCPSVGMRPVCAGVYVYVCVFVLAKCAHGGRG